MEVQSNHSVMHQWKPSKHLEQEQIWDKKVMNFACARGSSDIRESQENQGKLGDSDPMAVNRDIVKGLEQMRMLYEMDNVKGKALGYRKAISMIKSLKQPISSVQQIENLSGVGDGIKKKIEEFLATGKMSKVEFLSKD